MTERSLSHKSDGRYSSAGQSVHSNHSVPSGRTSSLGLDTNFMIGGQQDEDSPLSMPEPPPGLFILGTVPSIIRCWLSTNFSHSSLLYGAVCTGSQRSVLDYSLVKELGLVERIEKRRDGHNTIRLPVYLPEAVITQTISRSNSPAPQLPTLTSDFEIVGLNQRLVPDQKLGIRVFLGSDTLRVHNADILFSQNLMTLYGDDRNKLSVPFVRPEDESMFRNLCTANILPEKIELKATAPPFTPAELKTKVAHTPTATSHVLQSESEKDNQSNLLGLIENPLKSTDQSLSRININTTSELTCLDDAAIIRSGTAGLNDNVSSFEKSSNYPAEKNETARVSPSTDPARRESSGGIWGSWRQGTAANSSESGDFTSGYQRASKVGRNMKVLKPSKSIAVAPSSSRSSSMARTGAALEPAPSRPPGESRQKSQAGGADNAPLQWDSKRSAGDEQKGLRNNTTVPRSSNPVGGASAFAWMNTGKPKTSARAAE